MKSDVLPSLSQNYSKFLGLCGRPFDFWRDGVCVRTREATLVCGVRFLFVVMIELFVMKIKS